MKYIYLIALILLFNACQLFGQTISTFAGDGNYGWEDGAANIAQFGGPEQLAMDNENNIYVSDRDNNVIRKISPDGTVSTYAGTGVNGNALGNRLEAQFSIPQGLCFDKVNNYLYISDTGNDQIKRINAEGNVEIVAGSSFGFADGPLLSAQFYNPTYIDVDFEGNIYVADIDNERVRKVDFENALVTTIGGDGTIGYNDGDAATSQFNRPRGVAVDNNLNVFVADQENDVIRKITPEGIVSTLAGNGLPGFKDGPIEVARFRGPKGISIDSLGNLYISDRLNYVVRKIDTNNQVSTVAGQPGISGYQDGPLEQSLIGRSVHTISLDNNRLFVTDWENDVIRLIDFNGVVSDIIELKNPNINVFPNPSSNYFQIESEEKIKEFSLYNSNMEIIKKGIHIANNKAVVDLTNCVNGIYHLKLITNDHNIVNKRLVKI